VPVVSSQLCMTILSDELYCLSSVRQERMQAHLSKLNISESAYFYLLSPGMEFLMKSVGRNANKEAFQSTLQMYRDHSNDCMTLKHIVDSFQPSFYAHAVLGMVTLIKTASPSCTSVVDVFASLGRQLSVHPPPEEQRLQVRSCTHYRRLVHTTDLHIYMSISTHLHPSTPSHLYTCVQVLNDVWKVVSKSTDLLSYVKCSGAWLDLVQKYYSQRELAVLLSNLCSRLEAYRLGAGAGAVGGTEGMNTTE
jgi:hypothetical protein